MHEVSQKAMSSITATAAVTLSFTGTDLKSVHEQIAKYYTEMGLADPKGAAFKYEDGLIVDMTESEFFTYLGLEKSSEPVNCERYARLWDAYTTLRTECNSMITNMATASRELAAKHFPVQQTLAAEFIYYRWLRYAIEEVRDRIVDFSDELSIAKMPYDRDRLRGLAKGPVCNCSWGYSIGDRDIFDKEKLHMRYFDLAVKLVKAGWKSYEEGKVTNTEFELVRDLCNSYPIIDGEPLNTGTEVISKYHIDKALAKMK
jgi:hypothetical protein